MSLTKGTGWHEAAEGTSVQRRTTSLVSYVNCLQEAGGSSGLENSSQQKRRPADAYPLCFSSTTGRKVYPYWIKICQPIVLRSTVFGGRMGKWQVPGKIPSI